MPTSPKLSDFPNNIKLTITPPPRTASNGRAPPNILILLHGIGDGYQSFTNLAKALELPETTIIVLQAPTPLPFDIGGFHWGDDLVFETDGSVDMYAMLDADPGFEKAKKLLVEDVIRDVLIAKCGYHANNVLLMGYMQGGMVALSAALQMEKRGTAGENERELRGVIAISAPLPLSAFCEGTEKAKTPVLMLAGRGVDTGVPQSLVSRTKTQFQHVTMHRWEKTNDGMPEKRSEMLPIMEFLARRLLSEAGVPWDAVEVGR
ncbi:hypothetical protein FQN54_005413 [Arachnomyces sp. PD_36]|nr:hypothetical protein FQN54_005413 [Arachnomyces sp. PD_36]